MIVYIPIIGPRNWTTAPNDLTLAELHINDNGQAKKYKRIASKEAISELLKCIEQDTTYVLYGYLLYAWVVYTNPLSTEAKQLTKYVKAGRFRCLQACFAATKAVRKWKSVFTKVRKTPTVDDYCTEAFKYDELLSQKTHLYGAAVELQSNTAALCLTWQGINIDVALLHENLEAMSKQAISGVNKTLQSHHQAVKRCINVDNRIRPVYHRQDGCRLGAYYPNIQSFTSKGEAWASKKLIIPPINGCIATLDVRMAELHALAYRWKTAFPTDARSHTLYNHLHEGLDIHQLAGEKVKTGQTSTAVRAIGKTLNFAMLNMSGLETINKHLSDNGIPAISEKDFEDYKAWFTTQYPVDLWHNRALKSKYPSHIQTDYGRKIRVDRPSQHTGYQFQVPTGDATAIGVLELFLKGFKPIALIHDEVLVELDTTVVDPKKQKLQSCYLKGFQALMPKSRPEVRSSFYFERWA